MKLTKSKLRQIIKEELNKLSEDDQAAFLHRGGDIEGDDLFATAPREKDWSKKTRNVGRELDRLSGGDPLGYLLSLGFSEQAASELIGMTKGS
mgnify:CR=1 FL=1